MRFIKDTLWYCGRSNVGIVRTEDEYEGRKYYIGSPPDCGHDELRDSEWIADWGSTFDRRAGDLLFGVENANN